ncbi:N-formylglutamate amidohydrolase [Pseudooceanicola sediminis]|uniref:N-formylglutamate amidohydrolase n=1 Tax=Pseudooceanicola sediminis TaxID=2211117 RepID=A0A399IX86_9RHOB|nr:N-formylglutamate amidohydrolase [Pseudooceanicola sediminis]KAA2312566.1 N-formylglutamate amidohydrolase [Puniceibacterium sp. HSS470]RII37574.1 N-formylglutamate amidohydrolase [Pseudooceanicola sediminis]|tara:strand:- start:11660 stop:12520 length:861 start_codon:yes stop_codon:yes gene_type:complete
MTRSAFELFRPVRLGTSVVFASPHSGRDYPDDLMQRTRLDRHQVRSSEDAFIDRLFASAPDVGAPLLCATAPRAYVDMNRAIDELDPALVEGVRRRGHNPRIASGLGVIPRVVAGGMPIYHGKLTLEEAEARLERTWKPYHATLQSLLNEARAAFGEAILLDCHSMPHEALDGVARNARRRPEVVIGDRFGASADSFLIDRIEAAFVNAGLNVVRNAPFAGAYVTQHYGRPARAQHAVQIEIDRAIYMDEARIEPLPRFDAFAEVIRGVVAEIADLGRSGVPLAAE